MKTTIDIPEIELKEAMKYTGAKTKRAAVLHIIREFNRRRRLARLSDVLGTFSDFMSQDDLKKIRENDKWEKTK